MTRSATLLWVMVAVLSAAAPAGLIAQTASGDPQASIDTRLKLAQTLLHAQRYSEAVAEYRKVLAQQPKHRDAALGMARAYFWSGQPKQAAEALAPIISEKPDAEVLALWNEILGANGDTLASLKAIQERVQANPQDPQLTQTHARLLIEAGCYAQAAQVLSDSLKARPDNAELALDLALAYYTGDRDPEALAAAKPYLGKGGTAARRAALIRARVLMRSWQLPEAAAALEQAAAVDPGDPRPCLGRLRLAAVKPSLYGTAVQDCMSLLEKDSARALLHEDSDVRDWLFALAGTLTGANVQPKADEKSDDSDTPQNAELSAAAQQEDTTASSVLARRLADLLKNDDRRPATQLCREAMLQRAESPTAEIDLDIEPTLAAVRAGKVDRGAIIEACSALLYLYQGEQLVALSDAALERQPADLTAALFRAEGLSVLAEPEYVEAYEQYLAILEVLPECTKARRGAARTYSWYQMFKEATATYNDLAQRDPGDMAIRREAARSLGWDKQIRVSLDAYDEAADTLGESEPEAIWRKRLELERAGKKAFWWARDTKAVDTYSEAIDLEPSNLEARFDLAQVYARRRHWEEAAGQYAEILQIDARHRRARDALYKNGVYHRPELRTTFDWTVESGRGTLVDVESVRLTEVLKQEIALRTDFSVINTQKWNYFRRFGGHSVDEYHVMGRIDHVFNLKTRGHIASGYANLVGSDLEDRWIADVALTHDFTGWLNATVGGTQRPWIRNYKTTKLGMDESRLFVRLFGGVDPWLDWFTEYGRSWIDKGTWWPVPDEDPEVSCSNGLDELLWGVNYRFSLFPKILQFEYRGYAWFYEREVPAYWSPSDFVVQTFRLAWRHYLNNDQYVEQKQFYYELGMTGSIDQDGIGGVGYDAALGWDICHHFGFELKWNQFASSVYESRTAYAQIVARF